MNNSYKRLIDEGFISNLIRDFRNARADLQHARKVGQTELAKRKEAAAAAKKAKNTKNRNR